MQKVRMILALCSIFFIGILSRAAVEPNVVIEELNAYIRFVPDKDGSKVKEVNYDKQFTFRANRVAATAFAQVYYNDDIKIKASGGEQSYGSYFSDDIFFSDSKSCLVAVELKKAGAKAKASISRTYTRPEFCTRLFIAENYKVEKKTITIELPANIAQRFKFIERNMPEGSYQKLIANKGDKVIYTYTIHDIAIPKSYDDGPSINKTMPQILVTGHFADITELYKFLRGYLPESDPGAETVAAKAREITAECSSDFERISAITDFVHSNIRYVAVEHGEFSHRPDLPSEVLRKRFGDCKCSAALLKAMFCAVGLDGRLAWVGSGDIATRWSEIPNISSGNHMICAIVGGDSIQYIDGTATHTPAGQYPRGIWRSEALIEDGPERCFIDTIPGHSSDIEYLSHDLNLAIAPESGVLVSTGKIVFSGSYASMVKYMADNTAPAKRDGLYKSLYANALADSRVTDCDIEQTPTKVVLSGKAYVTTAIKKAGNETYVDLNPSTQISDFKIKTDEERNVGGSINGFEQRCDMRFYIPEGMAVADIPKDVHIDNEWISGKLISKLSDDGKSIERKFDISVKRNDIPFESLKTYNTDINKLIRACAAKIVLKEI